jgi:hypothetical protein
MVTKLYTKKIVLKIVNNQNSDGSAKIKHSKMHKQHTTASRLHHIERVDRGVNFLSVDFYQLLLI